LFADIQFIFTYIVESFLHIWPYLLLTIPISVTVQMTGTSKYIRQAFFAQPVLAIFLSTLVGAFSPLCSCSVVPVVATLLIGGVPLAPVMSFWLASPSMDPEIFLLTVSMLGWELAVWRLIATLVLSLGSGLIVLIMTQRGWLGTDILRPIQVVGIKTISQVLKTSWESLKTTLSQKQLAVQPVTIALSGNPCETGEEATITTELNLDTRLSNAISSSTNTADQPFACVCPDTENSPTPSNKSTFWHQLFQEIWKALIMITKFMLLAWFLGALIRIYVDEAWITTLLGQQNTWGVVFAALLGIPVYTSNLAAMPLIGGLLEQGMHPAAALAFLIAGPMTTLPAMSAVWGLVKKKVFGLYLGFALFGAVTLGYVYYFTLTL
jgi:uncharacterized membrane protein YraQ (UPF0718 family)